MKRIVLDTTPIETIELRKLSSHNNVEIVAYETTNSTGLGVLINRDNEWGFAYHIDLVMGRYSFLKFCSASREGAIKNAINACRKVLLFSDFKEFTKHAAKHSKL